MAVVTQFATLGRFRAAPALTTPAAAYCAAAFSWEDRPLPVASLLPVAAYPPAAQARRLGKEPPAVPQLLQQRRSAVFSALNNRGPVQAIHNKVAAKFVRLSSGSPPLISIAQLIQLLYELGLFNAGKVSVGEVMDLFNQHGLYKQTNPMKRDSYGPPSPPKLGLDECKRLATVAFFAEQQKEHRRKAGEERRPPPTPLKKSRAIFCGVRTAGCVLEHPDFLKGIAT